MDGKITYTFTSTMWKEAAGSWYFISLPKDISQEIRGNLQWQEEGWGRMKATAQIGTVKWDTAIWFDTKGGTYYLPVKAAIRKKAKLTTDTNLDVTLWV
ncbi:DUF1905 domain-containing protein [Flagellimonas myxillae]|uniref:DUF1905 domain-containing protein n=1 Tax=Flagellimonas myxillae TaxID=2942214 RepID=UPI00201F6B77|nr:DUF1905 domain-containing protein [Muricauda myxillae]MCL6267182.1 DUF1905 domain-containing protein [Muricauda myxillae]